VIPLVDRGALDLQEEAVVAPAAAAAVQQRDRLAGHIGHWPVADIVPVAAGGAVLAVARGGDLLAAVQLRANNL
jgi:hypothetical protein